MVRDDRFYAFIVNRTSRSRSRIRRISIRKSWLKITAAAALLVFGVVVYGFYGLAQQAAHLRIDQENARLRDENNKQRDALNRLNQRVEAVEDASRRLVEMTGVEPVSAPVEIDVSSNGGGQGGPELPLDVTVNAVSYKADYVEQELRVYETVLRERTQIPSIWPVRGTLESGLGGRRNPFGGSSFEYHEGLDIDAEAGDPVFAAASGMVTVAGWQNGYGQVVYIDHGDGLTTRYGHLSKVDVAVGQRLTRGELLGLVGSTGRSTGPHLHYEVRINSQPVDPKRYLPGLD